MNTRPAGPAPSLAEGLDAFERGEFRLARNAFEAAAARKDPVAQSYLAMLRWLGKGGFKADPKAALPAMRAAAEAGVASAQVNLGLAYLHGIGAPQDDREAHHWFNEAAHRRAPAGAFYLAQMAAEGRVEPHDLSRARALWTMSAERGFPPAMSALGMAFAEGRGGPADPIEGLTWLCTAAATGAGEEAAAAARQLARRMRAADIAVAQRRGKALAKRLARFSLWAEEPHTRP